MADDRLLYLFDRYRSNRCSPDELQELSLLCLLPENKTNLEKLAEAMWEEIPADQDMPADAGELILQRIMKPSFQKPALEQTKVRKLWWRRIAVAASIVLALGAGSYFLFFNKSTKQGDVVVAETKDVKAPETNRAMITLADGRKVFLDSVGNGELATQGNIKLVKLDNGQIAYQTANGEIIKEIQYNTLSNPRGSKVIDMQLSDGSHVWLNAGSSVTYPVAFVGNERKVSMTGEAYFEITHDASKPFHVSKGDMIVQVLGTKFNVNAYDDEADIQVTLLEGSVKVQNITGSVTIKPGQQARLTSDQQPVTSNPDLELVMAWKNGLFSFDNADLPAVMRQLSKWYDIEIAYAGKIPDGRFKGEIPRDLTLSQLLNGLTSTRIHFKIEGNKKIIILPE